MKKILCFLILIFPLSCQPPNTSPYKKLVQIDLDTDSDDVSYSQLFEDPQFILLEESKDHLIASPYQFQFRNGKIFLRDIDFHNIHVFSSSGKFERAILSSGNGPGEFSQINDYYVTSDKVIIQDTFLRKMITLDWEGNFISEEKHLINNSNFAFHDGKFLLYMANDPDFDGFNYLVEQDKAIISKLLPIEEGLLNSGKSTKPNSFIDLGNDRFLHYRPYTTQIDVINLKDLTLDQSVVFDFGKYQLLSENQLFKGAGYYDFVSENNLVSNLITFLPAANHFFAPFIQGNRDYYLAVLDANYDPIILAKNPTNDFFPISMKFPWTTDGERIYFVLNSIDFYNQYVDSFTGQSVRIEMGNIHDFFKKNKDKLVDDQTVLVSMKVRDDLQNLKKD